MGVLYARFTITLLRYNYPNGFLNDENTIFFVNWIISLYNKFSKESGLLIDLNKLYFRESYYVSNHM